MKTGEKIKLKMKEKGVKSNAALYHEIKDLFGPEAITASTLYRIINNQSKHPRLKHVSQIATVLNCVTSEFYQEKSKEIKGVYKYNDLAKMVNLSDDLSIQPRQILLKMGGKTHKEQEKVNVLRWVYVYNGEMILHLLKNTGEEKIDLKTSQHYNFDASIPHYYECRARTGCLFIRVNCP